MTRGVDQRKGAAIVHRARVMGIVPDFKVGVPLKKQTLETQWALHVLAVMSKGGEPPRKEDVKRVIAETEDVINKQHPNHTPP